MSIPSLKRVKIETIAALDVWLSKNHEHRDSVMLILLDKSSGDKHIPRDVIIEAVKRGGWNSGRIYTLNGNQLGHVISPPEKRA
jgi:hypothetical protein